MFCSSSSAHDKVLVWVMARPICAFMREFKELNMMVALLGPNINSPGKVQPGAKGKGACL